MIMRGPLHIMQSASVDRHRSKAEAGSALLASVLLISLITGAGLTAMMTTSVNQNKAHNLLNDKQAFYLAEAGLAHGKVILNQNIANWNNYATPQTLIASTSLAGVGSYTVTIKAASGPGLLMTATGTGPNNASTSVSSLVTIGNSNYGSAFITGTDLTISGNPTIDGTAGGVYANRNLTISGNPHMTTDAMAVGTYTVTGSPVVSGFAGGGQPSIPVNYVDPSTYYGASAIDYYLWNDGTVKDTNFNTLATGGTWNCWTLSGGNWTVTCSTPPNGTYWSYGTVLITSDVGTQASPWIATILGNYSIEVSSTNLYMRPPAQTDPNGLYKSLTRNLLFVAGHDLKIDGTATQNFSGIARAYEQVGISGNPTFNGYIIAQDTTNNNSRVTVNNISGNMHLTYNGNLSNGLQGTAQVQSTLY
jgi:hypothetical protein